MDIRILHLVGTRPNVIKLAPVFSALAFYPRFRQLIAHTGQHFHRNLADGLFEELGLPQPNYRLRAGRKSDLGQISFMLTGVEKILLRLVPHLVIVYGDVNSTLAGALAASKLRIPVAHVEAGLRCFDRTLPEENNRVLVDHLSDLLFAPSTDAAKNLRREGIEKKRIYLAGNVMIDTLIERLPRAETLWKKRWRRRFGGKPFALVTLHRQENVDDSLKLERILKSLNRLGEKISLVFPVHPRTHRNMRGLSSCTKKLVMTPPLPYTDFLALLKHARLVITDSGGVQEESSFLGLPCFTLRSCTERPVTVERGTNTLAGKDPKLLEREIERSLAGHRKRPRLPACWDGRAGERIAATIAEWLKGASHPSRKL